MASLVRPTAMLLLIAAGWAAAPAAAQQDERCTGTLCDLYYGNAPPPPPKSPQPAGPTVLTVPSGGYLGRIFGGSDAAPAAASAGTATAPARPLLGVGGGGLAAMARGAPAERCTGTLCDLYYGGPPPETPEPVAAPSVPAATAPVEAPVRRTRGRRARATEPLVETEEVIERHPPSYCAATAGDPWQCYRR